jgi:hypothetical protein
MGRKASRNAINGENLLKNKSKSAETLKMKRIEKLIRSKLQK